MNAHNEEYQTVKVQVGAMVKASGKYWPRKVKHVVCGDGVVVTVIVILATIAILMHIITVLCLVLSPSLSLLSVLYFHAVLSRCCSCHSFHV